MDSTEEVVQLSRVIAVMESRESWTIDDDDNIRALLTRMGQMYSSPHLAEWALNHPKAALVALGSLSTGKCIEIIRALDQTKPGFANTLLLYAQRERSNPMMGLLPKRLFCLERAGMLASIFSPERFQAIEAVIQSYRARGAR